MAQLRRFRVKAGKHYVNGPDTQDANGNRIKGPLLCYDSSDHRHNIIETTQDLVKDHGAGKFEEVGMDNMREPAEARAATPPKPLKDIKEQHARDQNPKQSDHKDHEEAEEGDEFDDMTVHQLIEYAQNNEIDLEGATRKADILAILRK